MKSYRATINPSLMLYAQSTYINSMSRSNLCARTDLLRNLREIFAAIAQTQTAEQSMRTRQIIVQHTPSLNKSDGVSYRGGAGCI